MANKEQENQVDVLVNGELLPIKRVDPYIEEMLRGDHAIGMFRDQLEQQGYRVPADYRFKKLDKDAIDAANSAVFSLIGGVPAFMLWAAKNPDKFYANWMKSSSDSNVQVNTNNITVVSELPTTDLDTVELDALGRIIPDTGGF